MVSYRQFILIPPHFRCLEVFRLLLKGMMDIDETRNGGVGDMELEGDILTADVLEDSFYQPPDDAQTTETPPRQVRYEFEAPCRISRFSTVPL